jgi:hypothetical protein
LDDVELDFLAFGESPETVAGLIGEGHAGWDG